MRGRNDWGKRLTGVQKLLKRESRTTPSKNSQTKSILLVVTCYQSTNEPFLSLNIASSLSPAFLILSSETCFKQRTSNEKFNVWPFLTLATFLSCFTFERFLPVSFLTLSFFSCFFTLLHFLRAVVFLWNTKRKKS